MRAHHSNSGAAAQKLSQDQVRTAAACIVRSFTCATVHARMRSTAQQQHVRMAADQARARQPRRATTRCICLAALIPRLATLATPARPSPPSPSPCWLPCVRYLTFIPIAPTCWTLLSLGYHPQVREIAAIKLPDLNCSDLDAACNTVMGTAKNMGITVEA